MNEVNKIHLGRQAFTISVDAHKQLQAYLDAIKKQVGDSDVVDEVELRMVELLAEHNVTGDKVILPTDINFLKKQLGNPKDFKEDGDDEISAPLTQNADTKRLFRDTDNAMVAGVASGLAMYFGVDVLLIRILFVIGIFTGGWGILIYALLWLLVPEVKTSSDRLQMAGKPVTVASLKEVVERADVKGVANRAGHSIVGPINSIFRLILKGIGVVLILSGLSALFGLIAVTIYLLLHNGSIFQDNIFPIGLREHALVYIGLAVSGILALFVVLSGMALFRRKWPIRAWITGMLIGLVFVGSAAAGALGADVAPQVRDRYNANTHTNVRTLTAFDKVNPIGDDVDIKYQPSDTYSVSFHYYDNPDLSKIKTTVSNGTLLIDSQQFHDRHNCQKICLPYNVVVTIQSPTIPGIITPDGPTLMYLPPKVPYDQ